MQRLWVSVYRMCFIGDMKKVRVVQVYVYYHARSIFVEIWPETTEKKKLIFFLSGPKSVAFSRLSIQNTIDLSIEIHGEQVDRTSHYNRDVYVYHRFQNLMRLTVPARIPHRVAPSCNNPLSLLRVCVCACVKYAITINFLRGNKFIHKS